MSLKLLGGLLLLGGSGLVVLRRIHGQRLQLRQMWALAGMLERMEGAIRWEKLPLPRILQAEAQEGSCGLYVQTICELMAGGIPLQQAWLQGFSGVSDEAMQILRRVELQGDSQQITGSLHLAAQQMRSRAEALEGEQTRGERLSVTLGLSFAAMVVILLI